MKKKRRGDGSTVNSRLLRKPIQRCFPLFLLPTFGAFIIGFIWPFLQGLYLSFCTFTTTKNRTFTGFSNYIKAINDASFRHAFSYTAVYAITTVVVINFFAFLIAYALTQKIKGANLFRTVFFMPNLIGGIVLGYIWSMIFDGVLSKYGTSIMLETKYGFWGLVILICWQKIGYMMIIYIAGLQAISEEMMEAAKIDGANGLQTLFHVTIPNVMPSITICMFLTLTDGFKLFDQNLALTNGQPFTWAGTEQIKTTEMLALNIYNTFYNSAASARGVAQAKAVLFTILVAGLSIAQLSFSKSREVQS